MAGGLILYRNEQQNPLRRCLKGLHKVMIIVEPIQGSVELA